MLRHHQPVAFTEPDSTRNLKPETRNCILVRRGAVAQFGRAPRSQCGGQGFDPPLLHQNSSIFNYLQDRSKGLKFPNDQYVTKVHRGQGMRGGRRDRSPPTNTRPLNGWALTTGCMFFSTAPPNLRSRLFRIRLASIGNRCQRLIVTASARMRF